MEGEGGGIVLDRGNALEVGEDGGDAKGRRARQKFSWSQLSVLEHVFESNPLPQHELLGELSERLGISTRCAQVWFQNRRQKFKAYHSAHGHEAPALKNAASRRTSLEKLLPDLIACGQTQDGTCIYVPKPAQLQAAQYVTSQVPAVQSSVVYRCTACRTHWAPPALSYAHL